MAWACWSDWDQDQEHKNIIRTSIFEMSMNVDSYRGFSFGASDLLVNVFYDLKLCHCVEEPSCIEEMQMNEYIIGLRRSQTSLWSLCNLERKTLKLRLCSAQVKSGNFRDF